ncbi:SpaH/EbpB family LPXTG-anchored major pilin [Psychromicrobium xiongbiense]|uniref:SpaH/EbpB family LPXTG-anchored major pilin n=1 Tax=Psychromicrobium xiongbiense TaxID=3051184 RepID=UPI002553ED24|nr:SpaH/EbpB family LPXTG-anchored major pilin [Psychromicrobium sp. YIM S02556]
MTTTTRRWGARRSLQLVGVTVLGLLGALLGGGAASAATPPNLPPGPYDIAIHKFVQPATPTNLAHDGTAVNTAGLTPLAGVTYQIQLVNNVDLSTNAGWTTAGKLTVSSNGTVSDGTTTYTLGTGTTKVTDVNGLADFSGITQMGVYVVTEVSAGSNQITQLAPPFLVSVPLPTTGSAGWLSTVNVYPKNPTTSITKTVDDSAAHGLGDTVNWTVTAKVPNIPSGQDLTSFSLTDPLDSRLTYTPSSAVVTFTDAANNPVTLASGDYTVALNGGTLTVTFTAQGLTNLKAHQGGTVKLAFATTVNSIGSGTIQNTASVNVNNTSFPSSSVQTTWGAASIHKQDADTQKALQGAVFSVYLSTADAAAGTNPVGVLVGGTKATTFTTDASGNTTIPGLKTGTYYLVETQAPVGYQVAAGFTPSSPYTLTVQTGSVANAPVVQVSDPPVPPFSLPLTGGSGAAMFLIGGIGLISVAGGAALVRARRKRGAQH